MFWLLAEASAGSREWWFGQGIAVVLLAIVGIVLWRLTIWSERVIVTPLISVHLDLIAALVKSLAAQDKKTETMLENQKVMYNKVLESQTTIINLLTARSTGSTNDAK